MRTITIELPDNATAADFDTRMRIAVTLYNHDVLLLSQCATLVGLDKRAFIEQASRYGGLSMGPQSAEELRQDFRNA